MGIDFAFYLDRAERRAPSPRRSAHLLQRVTSRVRCCLTVLAGPSARELGQDRHRPAG